MGTDFTHFHINPYEFSIEVNKMYDSAAPKFDLEVDGKMKKFDTDD